MKNKYLWAPEVEIPGKVVELYQSYQQSLLDYQRLDFDDILIKAVELWEEDPDWLAPYKNQFLHLFIDEFQDISLIQYKLDPKLDERRPKRVSYRGSQPGDIRISRGNSPVF